MWRIKYVSDDHHDLNNNTYLVEGFLWTKEAGKARTFETWADAARALFERKSERGPENWPYYRLAYRAE